MFYAEVCHDLPKLSTLPATDTQSLVSTLSMAMMARRGALQKEDEESDEEEESEEWSD